MPSLFILPEGAIRFHFDLNGNIRPYDTNLQINSGIQITWADNIQYMRIFNNNNANTCRYFFNACKRLRNDYCPPFLSKL